MGVRPAGGFTSVYIAQLQKLLPAVVSQDITNTLWAYATLKELLPSPILGAAAQRLQTFLPDLGAPAICQIAFAYAHYRHSPSNDLLDSMSLQFQQLRPPAGTAAVAMMCQLYKSMGLQPDVGWFKDC